MFGFYIVEYNSLYWLSKQVLGQPAHHALRPERRIWIPIPSHTTRAHATILLTTILYYSLSNCTLSGKAADSTNDDPEDPK